MQTYLRAIVAVAVLTTMPLSARAEPTARDFLQKIDKGGDSARVYRMAMHAYGAGIEWAHSAMTMEGAKPMYCMPENLAISADQTISMVRQAIKATPEVADAPAGLAVWAAYLYTFPC